MTLLRKLAFSLTCCFTVASAAWAAEPANTRRSVTIDEAFYLVQVKRSPQPEAMAALLDYAHAGNSEAAALLGVAYINGNAAPKNVPLGYAWLQLAANDPNAPMAELIVRQARQLMRKVAPTMTAEELLEADRLLGQLTGDQNAYFAGVIGPVLRAHYTAISPATYYPDLRFAEPVEVTPPAGAPRDSTFIVGCRGREQERCGDDNPSVESCTGHIVPADVLPATRSESSQIVWPDYPVSLRRAGVEGMVTLLAHVDRSGWICSVALAVSSGVPALDHAAITAVPQWRIGPAMKSGSAVESLYVFKVQFRLTH